MTVSEAVAFREVVLQRLEVAARQSITSYVLRNATVDVHTDRIVDALTVQLRSHVLADRLEPSSTEVTFDTWSSLWQHVKAAWFPTFSRWLRRPPRTATVSRTVTASNFATFPECGRDYPVDLGAPVRLTMFDPRPWGYA